MSILDTFTVLAICTVKMIMIWGASSNNDNEEDKMEDLKCGHIQYSVRIQEGNLITTLPEF